MHISPPLVPGHFYIEIGTQMSPNCASPSPRGPCLAHGVQYTLHSHPAQPLRVAGREQRVSSRPRLVLGSTQDAVISRSTHRHASHVHVICPPVASCLSRLTKHAFAARRGSICASAQTAPSAIAFSDQDPYARYAHKVALNLKEGDG